MVSFTNEQNIVCSQTQLDDIVHEQTIICRQLFVGHVVGFRPMKRKKNLHRKFFPNRARNYWLLRGHMISNNETVSRQNL